MEFLRRIARGLGGGARSPRIGKYRIIRRLAEGGMGEIFLARSEGRGGFEKVVVLKRILQQNMSDREAVRMFMDEARLQATFNNPNIVQVYDFGTSSGSHFFTMEYVHGEDLGRIVKAATMREQPLTLEFALGVIADAAAGLHYAHEKRGKDGHPLQIVHRDISPSNLLVSYDGAVKVTDFGIAKWNKRETETRYGALKGKIAYMSPEQCRGEPLDRRSDVFGLGILLFELTTGTRLFQGTSDFGILEQIVNHDAPSPTTRRNDYPTEIERMVVRALSRNRDRRHQTARALQIEIEEFALQARLKINPVGRAAEMEALFGRKIGAWREAAQAGRSLGEHLANFPDDAPFAPTLQIASDGETALPARTGTMPEGGAFGKTVSVRGERDRNRSGRRVALSLAAVGLLAAGASAAVLRRQARRSVAAPAPQRPAPRLAREAPKIEPLPPTEKPEVEPVTVEDPAPSSKGKSRNGRKQPPALAKPAGPPSTAPKKGWDPDSVFLPK